MKTLLAVALLVTSVSVLADWRLSNDYTTAYASSDNGAFVMAGKDNILMGNGNSSFNCSYSEGLVMPVNGQMVKLNRAWSNGFCMYAPASHAGKKFIRNQFITQQFVEFDGKEYSAKGFNDAMKQIGKKVSVL